MKIVTADEGLLSQHREPLALRIEELGSRDQLDLSRLDNVVLASDIAQGGAWLQEHASLGFTVPITRNRFSESVAMAITDVTAEDYIHHLILTADHPGVDEADALHILHHELIHIHDHNRMIDAGLNPRKLDRSLYEFYIVMPAKQCWSEYLANRLSAPTSTVKSVESALTVYGNTLVGTKRLIDAALFEYTSQRNRDQLLTALLKHTTMMLTNAAYVLGYLHAGATDGIDQEWFEDTVQKLSRGSYFEPLLRLLDARLQSMFGEYPECLQTGSPFAALSEVVLQFYNTFGVYPQDDAGEIYANIVC
jgi:hypothetical protein